MIKALSLFQSKRLIAAQLFITKSTKMAEILSPADRQPNMATWKARELTYLYGKY